MLFGKARTSHVFRPGVEAGRPSIEIRSPCLVQGVDYEGGMFAFGYVIHHLPDCGAMFTGFFAERYLVDIVQLSPGFLSALGQRRAKRYDAKTNSHEERETQVYDRSLLGL